MKTYTDEFKRDAVARVAAGESRKAVASNLQIAASLITTWRNKLEGKKKKKIKMRKYPPAVRAKALKLLASGVNQSQTAKRLGINGAIVHYWSNVRDKQIGKAKEKFVEKFDKRHNGAAQGTDKRDVRDAMVFFNKALKLAKQKGMDPWKDPVIININYGISLLETKV